MRAQSAIVHVTVRSPNTCEQRCKCSAICPLGSFPASGGSLLSGLPSSAGGGRDIREHCRVSPVPIHSKGRDNCREQNSLPLRWGASCLSFLVCTGIRERLPVCVRAKVSTYVRTHACTYVSTSVGAYARTCMREFFKALLTTFPDHPDTSLSSGQLFAFSITRLVWGKELVLAAARD